jgi:hypothetical protein
MISTKKNSLSTYLLIIGALLCTTAPTLISKNIVFPKQLQNIPSKPLTAEAWGNLLKENNPNFEPYKIIQAKYGTPEKTIDVTALLQKYADQGLFPDPSIEVMQAIQNGTLTDAQKQMLERFINEKLVYPLTDQQLEKIKANFQDMNLFFGEDPVSGKAKTLAVIAEMNMYEAWTRSFPPKPVGEKKNKRLYIIIPENKNLRGNYTFPTKTTMTEMIQPAKPENTDPLDIAQFNTQETIEAEIARITEFLKRADLTQEASQKYNATLNALQMKLYLLNFNTKEEIEAEIKRINDFMSRAKMTPEGAQTMNAQIDALQARLATLTIQSPEANDTNLPILLALKDLKDLIQNNDKRPFLINTAWYGIKDKSNNFDVTKQMQKYANNGLFVLPNDMNKFFGKDPYKKSKKTLFVDFTMQNQRYTISIPEHIRDRKELAFPAATQNILGITINKNKTIEANDGKPLETLLLPPKLPDQLPGANGAGLPPKLLEHPDWDRTPPLHPIDPIPQLKPNGVIEPLPDTNPIPEPDGSVSVGTLVEQSNFPQDGTIKLQDLNRILPANDQKAFKIIDAWYGVKDNAANITTDVITKLQSYADKGLFVIPENMNAFFGKDPIPNVKKVLYIKFNMQEHTYDLMIQEHKEDRGNYELPKKLEDKKWFVRYQSPAIFNMAKLNSFSYTERLENGFKMLTFVNNHKNNTKINLLINIFMQNLEYLLQNQSQATDAEKEKVISLLKNSRVVFTNTDKKIFEQGLQKIKDLATQYKVSFSISDSFDALKTIIAWDDKDDAKEFLEILQLLANLNKEGKMSFEETIQLMAIIGSAQITPENNRDEFSTEQETLKTIYKNLTVPQKQEPTSVTVVATPTSPEVGTPGEPVTPGKETTEVKLEIKKEDTSEPKPEVKPDPTLILAPQITEVKPSAMTYQARLQKLISLDALVSDSDKDACITLIEELVKDRACAANDQMNTLDGIIKYYINISPFFKNDAPRITKLETASKELNSGISYADRLAAAKHYIDIDSLAGEEQQEFIGILRALAQEKGKADINQLSNARAYLIMAQKRLTDENNKNLLSSIELLFNAPEKPVVQPEQQAAITAQTPVIPASPEAKPVDASLSTTPITPADVKAITIEKADNTASTAISTATVIATTGTTIQTAPEQQKTLRFADRIMNGFTQILATKMNQTDDALKSSFDLLQKLVDDRILGTTDDIKTLETLIIYAGSNIDNQGFKDKVKALAGTLGVSLDFSTQLKRCNDLMSSSDFATNGNIQKDALALLQRLVGNIPADASFDLMSNLKASLIVATRIFTDEKDKALLQSLQEKIAIPTVTSKPLVEETVKSPVSQEESINMRITKLTAIENLFSTAQRNTFLTQLQSIMNDRPRATQDRLQPVLAMIESAIANPIFKDSVTQLKEYQAILKRPATLAEQVAELEEMGSFATFLDFHNVEVLRVLQDLANQMGSITADSLTRIKAVIILLSPKIAIDFKDAFNALKAIFDAPASIVAPTAVTEVGEKISTTVTTANAATPVTSTTNQAPAATPATIQPTPVNATATQSSAATAAIASTIAAVAVSAPAATVTTYQAINAQLARNNGTLRTLRMRSQRATPGSNSAKNLTNETKALEQENSKLQAELQKTEPNKSVVSPGAQSSRTRATLGRRTVTRTAGTQRSTTSLTNTDQLRATSRTITRRRPGASRTVTPTPSTNAPAVTTDIPEVTTPQTRALSRRPMRPGTRPTRTLPTRRATNQSSEPATVTQTITPVSSEATSGNTIVTPAPTTETQARQARTSSRRPMRPGTRPTRTLPARRTTNQAPEAASAAQPATSATPEATSNTQTPTTEAQAAQAEKTITPAKTTKSDRQSLISTLRSRLRKTATNSQ